MDNETPADHGQLGWTVGTCTCLEGATKGTRLFRVEPGNCASHAMEQASVLLDSFLHWCDGQRTGAGLGIALPERYGQGLDG